MVIVLGVAALFVYVRLAVDLRETIDNAIRARSDDVAALIHRSGGALTDGTDSRFGGSEEGFIQVLTPGGRLLAGTTGLSDPALGARDARRASRAARTFQHPVTGVDGTARILARPVAIDGRTVVVVAGASLEDREDALSDLLTSFLIGGPVAVLLASGIGYLLASASFAPMDAMRRRANRISLTRSGERLPLPAAQDEVRRLGETLNEMLARLEASIEQERRFVADAGHELRTPLAVVKAELETAIRNEQDNPNVRVPLLAALEETDHLAQLADDLLLIARAADGRLPVRRELVDIGELLEQTAQRFADRAGEQGRAIRIDVAPDLRVTMDPLSGRQALRNLVDNALRYGAGDIRLAAREAGDALELDVSDEGPGFPPEFMAHAFERFARGDPTRARNGTGLGLAIVRAIARAHGGTAVIIDAPSPGATVRLRVPTREVTADAPSSGRDEVWPPDGRDGTVQAGGWGMDAGADPRSTVNPR
jgi:signal transduction histidine kinase